MKILRRMNRAVKWRLAWLRDSWPTWEETWTFRRGRPKGPRKNWFAGRDVKHLLLGLPALLALVLSLVFASLFLAQTREGLVTQYGRAATRAKSSRRYEEARVAYERLLQTEQQSNPSHIFGLAESLQGLGQAEEALALLGTIAPLDEPGYVPAHLALARALVRSPRPSSGLLATAETHLKLVLQANPLNDEAGLLLGVLYLQRGQWAPAREQLQKAYPAHREAALLLARVGKAQGDEPAAQKWAQEAQSWFKAEAKAKPRLVLPRVRWAEATLMLGQFADALEILNAGIAQSTDLAYREMASRVCEEWARKTARESPADLGARLSLIQRGLEYAPNNQQLLQRLIEMSHLSGTEAETARNRLNALLAAGGKDSAILHFCLGSDAWQRGHAEEARQHFKLAYELAPQMPYVANNLAMMLATANPPDLPGALAIVQPLAEKFPNDPHLLETRGQILVKMGKWQEGAKCLELALPSLASKAATHQALADAYQHLGLKELAQEHQRLAKAK